VERIDKILSSCGTMSRKDAGLAVRKGRVMVNGALVRSASEKINPDTDQIMLDGVPFLYHKVLWLMLNKPVGVLSAARDPKQKTVLDLVPEELRRKGLFPAGRLDKDTTGLLILTNDGEAAHHMLAPKSHVTKRYRARLDAPLPLDAKERFAKGIVLSDFTTLPSKLKILEEGNQPLCEVEIHEGKFHQIKRMFLALGCTVIELNRIAIGSLELDPLLKPGECRQMTEEEVKLVFREQSDKKPH
jgi:16S rRNA pseudouridine516 synthase